MRERERERGWEGRQHASIAMERARNNEHMQRERERERERLCATTRHWRWRGWRRWRGSWRGGGGRDGLRAVVICGIPGSACKEIAICGIPGSACKEIAICGIPGSAGKEIGALAIRGRPASCGRSAGDVFDILHAGAEEGPADRQMHATRCGTQGDLRRRSKVGYERRLRLGGPAGTLRGVT